MLSTIIKWLKALVSFAPAAIAVAEMTFTDPKQGAAKKAAAIADIKTALSDNGITVPSWIAAYEDYILGFIIDRIVSLLNKSDFFKNAAESQTAAQTA